MGKSIRSKIKKKFRSIKRKQLEPFVVEQVRLLYLPCVRRKSISAGQGVCELNRTPLATVEDHPGGSPGSGARARNERVAGAAQRSTQEGFANGMRGVRTCLPWRCYRRR